MTKIHFFSFFFKIPQVDAWLRGGMEIEHVLTEGVEEALGTVM